ncbi:MAG: thioredoxin family protein [Acidimicrobiales bacterium]
MALAARRRAASNTSPAPTGTVPTHIRRRDLGVGPQGWLLVTFTSADCSSCERVRERVEALASADVIVHDVEYGAEPDLHRRYGIDAVPLTVLVDREGRVGVAVLGPLSDEHEAELRSHVAQDH